MILHAVFYSLEAKKLQLLRLRAQTLDKNQLLADATVQMESGKRYSPNDYTRLHFANRNTRENPLIVVRAICAFTLSCTNQR